MKTAIMNYAKEISELRAIIELAHKTGTEGKWTARWYADMRVVLDSRIAELEKRIISRGMNNG